jgi:dynein heavy chain
MSSFLWATGLATHLSNIKEALQSTIPQIFEEPEMIDANEQLDELQDLVDKTTDDKVGAWASTITDDDKGRLSTPLLIRDPETRLLDHNFDKELMILLKDVKYLSGSRKSQIPSVALEIFESNETYLEYLHLLQVLTERYNH